ncbi:YifB family Mg chelatase-like AAA ATPase [Achromobacter seleniivolatilans]|uniref:YifB family Mg chelatase-like AAA ATPase n=1 Tax=Achromobacter seleniivolatilans TaxID=3047478 RepID=A0ABY9M7I5_9BURK|nr:YifB family Mg chelatase-like AAA ATPase [Achromobacter sp. R39]WMD22958.1 YifB family Mg chelatase-like AAA ATPase [Achromobacter sp. R39]
MTLAVLASRALSGLHAHAVRVETHLGPGLPSFNVVGLADTEVRESRERVRAAILNSGFEFPPGRITLNLSPADIPKESGRFDLPIALGLLLASGQLAAPVDGGGPELPAPDPSLAGLVLAGELSLTGALVPVAAPLVIALSVAREAPDATLILPAGSAEQAAWVPGLNVLSARSLADVAAHIAGMCQLPNAVPKAWPPPPPAPCLSDVRGQPGARRALEVAAAGGHSLLMIGPPGAGKSMLASRLPGLLPPLLRSQALEAAAVAALAGLPEALMGHPPFRSPHHSASVAALVGGGSRPRPGEISLAHHGVLFLDELPEFSRRTLEALREPLEAGRVVVARALHAAQFPARFQLVAAMNPCPCGWRGHPGRACICTSDQVARYTGKISGPLLDRIDLHVVLPPSDPEWMSHPPGEASGPVQERVMRCRDRQLARQGKSNAGLMGAELDEHCVMDGDAQALMLQAMRRLAGSGRALHRALRVARTIADLDGADVLGAGHVAQAVQYRRPGV